MNQTSNNDLAQRRLRGENASSAKDTDAQASVAATCYGEWVLPPIYSLFMPMGWGSHLYVQWLAKTNNQPSLDSISSYLANLCEICIVIEGSLPLSIIECHYRRVARDLRSHANFSVPAPLMKELGKSPMKLLVEAALSSRHTDIDTVSTQIARDAFLQYAGQRKIRIPYRQTVLDPEMGIIEVPVSLRVSEPVREPSGNRYEILVADVDRGSLEDSLMRLSVSSHNDLGQQLLRPKSAETPVAADAQVFAGPPCYEHISEDGNNL